MDRKRFTQVGLAGLLVLAACAPAAAPTMGTADDEAAIRASITAYASAYSARDAAALAQQVTEDYETVQPNGDKLSGRAAFQTAIAAEFATMPADMSMPVTATTDQLRWLSATTAAVAGTWSVAGMPAEAGPNHGSWLGVYRKDADGMWRMANGMSAPDMPPPVMPDTTKK